MADTCFVRGMKMELFGEGIVEALGLLRDFHMQDEHMVNLKIAAAKGSWGLLKQALGDVEECGSLMSSAQHAIERHVEDIDSNLSGMKSSDSYLGGDGALVSRQVRRLLKEVREGLRGEDN